MPLTYRDKTTGTVINLRDSQTEFVVEYERGDAEALLPLFSTKTLIVFRSSDRDGIALLRPRSETESLFAVSADIERIRKSTGVLNVAPAAIDASGKTQYMLPGRVLVQLQSGVNEGSELLTDYGFNILRRYRSPGLLELQVPSGAGLGDAIEKLNAIDRVVYAEPVFYGVDDRDIQVSVSVTRPTEGEAEGISPSAVLSWNLQKVDAFGAWGSTSGNEKVVVAIVDGMPEVDHEAIASKFFAKPDASLIFSADDSISSHATAVASVVAGDSQQMTGVAPDVRILPVIVNLQAQTYAERADAIRAVATIARAGAHDGVPLSRIVMSCSWKTSGDITAIRMALQEAIEAGVLPVFSAGNDGTSDPHFPSGYAGRDGILGTGIVSVAATDRDDRKADYSCYASSVSVSAPGGNGLPLDNRDIWCADLGNAYSFTAGTSIATPHVAAVAALVWSVNPNLAPGQVKSILLQSVDDISQFNTAYSHLIGAGRVNARKAVAAASGTTGSPSTPSPGTSSGPSFTVTRTTSNDAYNIILRSLESTAQDINAATEWSLVSATLRKGIDSIQIPVGGTSDV